MIPDPSADTDSALSGLYDRYFDVVPANTPALLDAAHALRYQVYCVEHSFEDRSRQIGERERDRVHGLGWLSSKPTRCIDIGCDILRQHNLPRWEAVHVQVAAINPCAGLTVLQDPLAREHRELETSMRRI
jgi:hypothetical protein